MRRVLVLLALLAPAGVAAADVAVDRSGRILRGPMQVRAEEGELSIRGRTYPLRSFCLVEDDEGRCLWAPDFRTRLRGYEHLVRSDLRDVYVRLLRDAIHVGDVALARRFLERAEAAGLTGREVAGHKRTIERKEAAGSSGTARSQRLLRMAQEAESVFSDLLVARARVAADELDRLRLLRTALARDPSHEAAKAMLADLAPESFPVGDRHAWLAWTLALEPSGASFAPAGDPDLEKARRLWRRDLHAISAGPMLLVTPVKDSRLAGRCIAHGQLASLALAELFATDQPRRDQFLPMLVFLFESKEEYLTRTGTGRKVEDRAFLEWTAGHYSPAERVSRFYWYADPDAERRIVGTFVHELTHQWLAERNPRVPAHGAAGGGPGFWVVEGFATFMEEGHYDVDRGVWDLFNPHSRSLDVMQAVSEKQSVLIPWEHFFELSQGDFAELPPAPAMPVPLRWQLGLPLIGPTRMFYEQAGAACQYLYHAEGGEYRARLADFVVNYYSGRGHRLKPETAFGMSGAELGERILDFAVKVRDGWRPDE